MTVFIYFDSPLNFPIGDLEDDLDAALDGHGEVTGSGTGVGGGNIDIEIRDSRMTNDIVASLVEKTLRAFGTDLPIILEIDGDRRRLNLR
jgi:hypothetical protein